MKSDALNTAWAISRVTPANTVSGVPTPKSTIIRPSWLTVPCARTSLMSCWRSARYPPISIDAMPAVTTIGRHGGYAANAGENRATRYTPAFTIVAECR